MDPHESFEPGEREPAPGELSLVQALVNTVDLEQGRDRLHDRQALHDWLAARDLVAANDEVSDAELRLVLRVREALRDLAAANHGDAPDRRAIAVLNEAARGTRLAVRFGDEGSASLQPTLPGVDGAVAKILGIVYSAMAKGTWRRLKTCGRSNCRWVFYDRSKNRSSTWCAMSVCGNREKARAYRRRREDSGK